MACKYTYKGITYNSKEEFIGQVINPQFLGKSNNTLPFIKSNNTIDDDFFIKDEFTVTKELQNIRTNNWDGSINKELEKLKNELNQLPVGSRFNTSAYTNPTPTNLEDVLNKITLSESNKVLLEKIKPLIKNIKIEYVDKFILANSGAVYSDKYNTIRINKSEKNIPLEELLMHELLHAATFRKISYFETNTKGLSEKELLALNELENIRKVLKEASDKYWDNKPRYARSVNPLEGYRTDSIHEIISYAFTNKEFRDAIAKIPYKGNKSILDKLVELIANIFGVKQDTILNALLANTEILLENNEVKSIPTKTRRILEVQSDLFQKGRDRDWLTGSKKIREADRRLNDDLYGGNSDELLKERNDIIEATKKSSENQFLQLLLKDNNWVTFFVKSIVQDSAKKGYEKVLFPSGNTASKVEGHATLEEFKKQKEDRIKELEKEIEKLDDSSYSDIRDRFYYDWEYGNDGETAFEEPTQEQVDNFVTKKIETHSKEIFQLKQEVERVEKEGFGALRPIYKFYEETVHNILKKQGFLPERINDEYGNEWYEVKLSSELATKTILFQKDLEPSKASSKTLAKVKAFLERIGVNVKNMREFGGSNGVADLLNNIIEIAQGKEEVALTEEGMHFAVAIIKQTNPSLFKQMMNRVGNFNYYKQIFNEYSKIYKNLDGSPDIAKIKEEAIGKILAEYLINDIEGSTEKPELLSQTLSWWQQIKDFFLTLIGKAGFNPFKEAIKEIDNVEDTNPLQAPYKELAERIASKNVPGIFGDAIMDALENGNYKGVVSIVAQQLEDPRTYNTIVQGYIGGDEELAQEILKTSKGFQQVASVEESLFDKINKKIADYQLVKKTDSSDPDDENNFSYYEIVENGKPVKVDRTTEWAKKENIRRNGGRDYLASATDTQKKYWSKKAMSGTNGHYAIEQLIKANLNPDGTLKPKDQWTAPSTSLVAAPVYEAMQKFFLGYQQPVTKDYVPGWLEQFPAGTKIGLEKMLYNEKARRASTLDFIAELPDGSIDVYDWKFMGFLLEKPDQAFLKRNQHVLQLGDYKKSLREAYGVKNVRAFTLPIHVEYIDKNVAGELVPVMKSVTFGKTNIKDETRTSLLPVTPKGQSSGNKEVDQLISSLESHYKKLYSKKEAPETKHVKIQQLEQLSAAIRNLQAALNFEPLKAELLNFKKNVEKAIEKYNELDFTGIDEETLSKQLSELLEYYNTAETYSRVDEVFSSVYPEEGMTDGQKSTLSFLRLGSSRAKEVKQEILEVLKKYAKYIAQKEGIDNILSPTKEVKGTLNSMLETGSISLPTANLLTKRALDARSEDKQKTAKLIKEFGDKYLALTKLSSDPFSLIGKGNELFRKTKREFWQQVEVAKEKQDREFFLKNINKDAFNKALEEEINKRIEVIEDTNYVVNNPKENAERRKQAILSLKKGLNIYDSKFNGWYEPAFNKLFKDHLIEEPHWTEEYKKLNSAGNEAALAMHTFLSSLNKKAFSLGYLQQGNSMSFFPFVTGTILERLAQANNVKGTITDILSDIYKIDASQEQAYGKTDEETGALEKTIPKLFTHTNREDEALSKDLLKVVPLYIRALVEYETSKDLEAEALTYLTLERNKGHLEVEGQGVIFDAEGPKEFKGNETNAKIIEGMTDWLVYGIRESSDTLFDTAASKIIKGTEEEKNKKTISAKKLVTEGNKWTQGLAVGLKALVAIPNYVGAHMQSIINAGLYYTPWEYEKNHVRIISNVISDVDKGLLELIVPLNDDLVKEGQRKIAKKQSPQKWLSTWTFQEFLMSTNQFPDKLHQLSNAKSFNDNAMVHNGKIVNIKQYLLSLPEYKERYSKGNVKEIEAKLQKEVETLRETKSLSKVAKFNSDGILEIPGISEEELAKYRTAVVEYGRKNTGQMSQENAAKYRQDILFKSFMMFKNWIPKQVSLRTLDIKKNPSLDQWEYGRTRLFLKTWAHLGLKNVLKMRDIISASPEGVKIMKEIIDQKREDYFKKTGLELTITDEEFYDMMRKELHAQAKELLILLSLVGMVVGAKLAAPPDDETDFHKNQYKFWAKAINKISDELWFYYNPTSTESITRGSIFPSLGLLSKSEKFIRDFSKWGMGGITGDEEAQEKAHPLKYFLNMMPVASQFQNELLPLLDPELAKEMGIRTTIEARAFR